MQSRHFYQQGRERDEGPSVQDDRRRNGRQACHGNLPLVRAGRLVAFCRCVPKLTDCFYPLCAAYASDVSTVVECELTTRC